MQMLEQRVMKELCMDGIVKPGQLVAGFHEGLLASLVQLSDTSLAHLTVCLLGC